MTLLSYSNELKQRLETQMLKGLETTLQERLRNDISGYSRVILARPRAARRVCLIIDAELRNATRKSER